VGLNVNFAVAEYSIAVLAVQSPLRLSHSGTLGQGAGLAVANNAKTQQIENVQNCTTELWPGFDGAVVINY
jgi:hypothetical protein